MMKLAPACLASLLLFITTSCRNNTNAVSSANTTQKTTAVDEVPRTKRASVSTKQLLVVMNTNSMDSVAIAEYYIAKRKVPAQNILKIVCPTTEECSEKEFQEQVKTPIQNYLKQQRLEVDFILLTKGFPIRLRDGAQASFCTDSVLAMMDWTLLTTKTPNPYFGKYDRFTHKKYNYYSVTRLEGYTREDCLHLVDNSLAGKPAKGVFLLHTGPGHEDGGYKFVNDGMRTAHQVLTSKALNSILDTNNKFPGDYTNLMGYFSWGSNDGNYDKRAYNSLRFIPGAIAETAVSTGARTFRDPNASGQSLVADLIAQGVTGVKGYVSEPYADAIAMANIMFDRYTGGFTSAESFYMASRWLFWEDIVIGDPLCAPYAAQ